MIAGRSVSKWSRGPRDLRSTGTRSSIRIPLGEGTTSQNGTNRPGERRDEEETGPITAEPKITAATVPRVAAITLIDALIDPDSTTPRVIELFRTTARDFTERAELPNHGLRAGRLAEILDALWIWLLGVGFGFSGTLWCDCCGIRQSKLAWVWKAYVCKFDIRFSWIVYVSLEFDRFCLRKLEF